MKSIDIVCPVFREEEVIRLFHKELANAIQPVTANYLVRILYVVDPAPDGTEQAIREICRADSRVSAIVMSRRFGHQAALAAGIDACDGDAVIMLDSDLQHPPELIPKLVMHWDQGADIVQAIRNESSDIGWAKRTSSRLFYQVASGLGEVDLRPGAADYRLISGRVADVFRSSLRERNPFLRGLIAWAGFTVAFVPFEPSIRAKGKSKYSPVRLFNFALNGICSFSKTPLRICAAVGLTLSLISILAGLIEVIAYFAGTVTVPGWASIMAIVSFIGGVQLFFLGVVGEYIALIFDEVKARPRYLVARRFGAMGDQFLSKQPYETGMAAPESLRGGVSAPQE